MFSGRPSERCLARLALPELLHRSLIFCQPPALVRPRSAFSTRRGGGESLRSLARCADAARNPRSNMSRVNVLDFTLWQEQWSLNWSRAAALCATRTSHARRSIGEILLSGHRRSIVSKDLRRLRHAYYPTSHLIPFAFILSKDIASVQ